MVVRKDAEAGVMMMDVSVKELGSERGATAPAGPANPDSRARDLERLPTHPATECGSHIFQMSGCLSRRPPAHAHAICRGCLLFLHAQKEIQALREPVLSGWPGSHGGTHDR